MRISVTEAEGQLTELVRLAGEGEEIVLTQGGLPAARLEPINSAIEQTPTSLAMELSRPLKLASVENPLSPAEKAKLIREIQDKVRRKNLPPGPDAARSQDFLYDENGLPG